MHKAPDCMSRTGALCARISQGSSFAFLLRRKKPPRRPRTYPLVETFHKLVTETEKQLAANPDSPLSVTRHLPGSRNVGRGGGIRTPDPLLPKQMRYQAALRPDFHPSYRTTCPAQRPPYRHPGARRPCSNDPLTQSSNRNGSIAISINPSPNSPIKTQSLPVSRRPVIRLRSSSA